MKRVRHERHEEFESHGDEEFDFVSSFQRTLRKRFQEEKPSAIDFISVYNYAFYNKRPKNGV